MRPIIVFLSLVLGTVVISSFDANAQTPQERAAEMVQWRENCNDPDPDLRLAYIESAIATGDVTIQRICIRCALESDSSDVKNLGIRAAIASKKQITFSVQAPEELKIALRKAGDDKKELSEIYSSRLYRAYDGLKNGLNFEISDTEVASSSSLWYTLVYVTERDDEYKGKAIVEGDKIIWVGKTWFGGMESGESSINIKLEPGGKLKGFYKYRDLPVFSITADLL